MLKKTIPALLKAAISPLLAMQLTFLLEVINIQLPDKRGINDDIR